MDYFDAKLFAKKVLNETGHSTGLRSPEPGDSYVVVSVPPIGYALHSTSEALAFIAGCKAGTRRKS